MNARLASATQPHSPISEVARPRFDAWLTQHTMLWAEHEWPEGTLMHVSTKADRAGRMVDVYDADAAWAYATKKRHEDVYVRVCPLRARKYAPGERGKRSDSVGMSALWLDVDTRGGNHKATDLPTAKDAGRIVRAVLEPSLIIATGGGFHCYWSLDEVVDPASEQGRALLRGWRTLWRDAFADRGFEVDAGMSGNPAAILRMAGTFSAKYTPAAPVRVKERDAFRTFTTADLLAMAPPPPVIDPTRSARVVGGPLARRVNAALPVTRLLVEAFGCVLVDDDRLVLKRADGSIPRDDTHAQIWTDDRGIQSVTAFGARLQRVLDVPDEAHSLRAWDLLVKTFGDPDMTAIIAKGLVRKPDLLIDAVREMRAKQAA